MTTDSQQKPISNDGTRAMGYIYVLLSAICFALAGVLIKSIDWNAFSISGARSILAAGVLYAYLKLQGKRMVFNRPTIKGACVNFLMLQTFVLSCKLTTAANAIVLQFTMPVWLILIMWAFMHKQPDKMAVACCVIIFAGIVFFFFDGLSPEGMIGNVLAVASGIFYSIVFLLKRIPGCDFESAAIISFLGCAVCGIPTMLGETEFGLVTIVCVVLLGVVQVGLAFVLLSKGLDSVDPVAAALISTVEPILNPIIVAAVLGETIGPMALLGAVLVIGGATAYNIYDANRAKTQ